MNSAEGAQEKEVQLGLPGAWAVVKDEASDHYTTKIGGSPDWPPALPHSLLRDDLLKCAVCKGWLGLVAQVHAPLSLLNAVNLTERIIFILGCPSPGCGAAPACWRALRVQRNPTTISNTGGETKDTSASPKPTKRGIESVEPSADWWEAENSWGVENLGGWGTASPQATEENSWGVKNPDMGAYATSHSDALLDMNDLAASLMEAGRMAAEGNGVGKSKSIRERNCGAAIATAKEMGTPNPKFALPVLPCFYVYFQGESISQEKASRSSPSPSSSSGDGVQNNAANSVEESGDAGGEAWEGEGYEPDRAVHVDRAYLRFKKHLDLSPEQCFRYCFGGRVLWAVDEEDEGLRVASPEGECGRCGGPRVYEMQLMPPLLYFLQQAMAKEDSVPAPLPLSLDEWDWFTVVVFTCAQSCSHKVEGSAVFGDGGVEWSVVEEATVLQQEVTRISPSDWRCDSVLMVRDDEGGSVKAV